MVEGVAALAAKAVLTAAASQGAKAAGGKLTDVRHRRVFSKIIDEAFDSFCDRYPQWKAALFDASFIEGEAAPILAGLLVPGRTVTPTALAAAWADSLAFHDPKQRRAKVRQIEPAIASLLDDIIDGLRGATEFRTLVAQDTVQNLRTELAAIRAALGADAATPGTRIDYLAWVRDRYSHVDPRGISQTERHVQVALDEVYVTLRAVDEGGAQNAYGAVGQAQHEARRSREDEGADVDAVLSQAQVVLLGDPGSGKTTVLRHLALTHAMADLSGSDRAGNYGPVRLPILIRVADYAESGLDGSLSSYLAPWHAVAEAPTEGLADLFDQAINAGEALILLDGLDEIVEADDRELIVKRIDDLVRRYLPSGNHFVVTSRIAGYRELPLGPGFSVSQLAPMRMVEIAAFLAQWCRAVEHSFTARTKEECERNAQREYSEIMDAIQNSPGVRQLATNPLLLTILTLIHRTGAAMPQRRVSLYALAAETLSSTWRRAQGVPQAALIDEVLLTRVLSGVAI